MSNTAACRILVVSPTLDRAKELIQRVKDLSDSQHGTNKIPSTSTLTKSVEPSGETSSSDASASSIPWTITNKYYTANIHFETHTFEQFGSHHASGVPAVIYVWSHGEIYKDHIPLLESKLEIHDMEVSLAVRLGGSASAELVLDTDNSLDEFISNHGFEYIDGDRVNRLPSGERDDLHEEDDSGIPGLPRVIDALSTIMWPSLVQSESTRNRRSRARDLLDWAREEEEDDGLRALVSPGDEGEVDEQTFDTPHSAKKSRMQREMDELEKWLEEDDQNLSVHHLKDHQAWIHPDIEALPDSWAGIPTPTLRISGSNNAEVNGFEDDFTEFVGAPVEVVYTHQERLKPHHTGTSYQSLASIEDTTVGDGDNDDPDLPSQAEIEQTTRKIFGNALLDASTSSHRPRSPAPNSIHASSSHLSAPGSTSTLPMTPDSPFSSFDHDNEDVDVEDDFELESFDLSRVLSALQGMKEEIAGMKDEGERRKAAARVALGLVYGLQKEEELDGVRTGGGR